MDLIFTELSTQTGPEQLRQAVTSWTNRVDEIAMAGEYADMSEAAYLHVSPILSGMVRIDGHRDSALDHKELGGVGLGGGMSA